MVLLRFVLVLGLWLGFWFGVYFWVRARLSVSDRNKIKVWI